MAQSALEQRLVGPLAQRIFGSYVEPEYAQALKANALPPNVRIEFFFSPGALLNCTPAQQNYLSANYTHVAREVPARGVNVIAHLVARRTVNGQLQLSLGSNPDVTLAPCARGACAPLPRRCCTAGPPRGTWRRCGAWTLSTRAASPRACSSGSWCSGSRRRASRSGALKLSACRSAAARASPADGAPPQACAPRGASSCAASSRAPCVAPRPGALPQA